MGRKRKGKERKRKLWQDRHARGRRLQVEEGVTPGTHSGGDIVGGNEDGLHGYSILPIKKPLDGPFQLRAIPGYCEGSDHGAGRECRQRL
jgi:hypothetical protein